MLVLTRKQQEKIRIGDNVVITVLRMKGKSVRLGIEAPGDVQVLRGELVFELTDDEKKEAGEEASEPPTRQDSRIRNTSAAAWPPGSHLATREIEDCQSEVDIGKVRVPRDSKTQVLSTLVQGGGPLRPMLDRRTVGS